MHVYSEQLMEVFVLSGGAGKTVVSSQTKNIKNKDKFFINWTLKGFLSTEFPEYGNI